MTGPACKCCGGRSANFGKADAARTCLDEKSRVFPPSARLITYWFCTSCGFVFTPDFDELSDAQMAEEIYNADYVKADPDFLEARPRYMAGKVDRLLGEKLRRIPVLDYGGGAGRLAQIMDARGFHFDNYDPFYGTAPLATGTYDLVTAFEVVEHSRTPLDTFREAVSALRPGGTLLFSTMLRPRRAGMEWWYVAPRNGHVSLHSHRSLLACSAAIGMDYASLSSGLHLFTYPGGSPLLDAILAHSPGAMLYDASLRGFQAYLHTARYLLRVPGPARQRALAPRHAARAALVTLGLLRHGRQ